MSFVRGTDSNVTSYDDVNGHTLLKMGRQLNKPLLTLIGMAVSNLHACAKWGTWSGCTAKYNGYIGIKRRTRTCGGNLKELSDLKTETDFSICEGRCRSDYNVTTNGFCMKLYTTKKTQDEAEKQCRADGGHLIHVNSDLKYGDVKTLLNGYSANMYIDGRRKDVKSPWVTEDGSAVTFFSWDSGDPDNGASDLCLILAAANRMFDAPCTTTWSFMCEIL